MPDYTFDAIYLGVYAELDTNEANMTVEQASTLVGTTFGGHGDPLWDKVTEITLEDADSSGSTLEDDMGQSAEDMTMGGVSASLDAALIYNVTITYTDGTSASSALVMGQDDMGRLFMLPFSSGTGALDDGYIRSIRLDSVNGDNYGALTSNRQDNSFLVCFAEGTQILTARGEVAVEDLTPGDLIETLDHGMQPVLWTGCRMVRPIGREAPVGIAAGALGRDMPRRRLTVSRQHRLLAMSPVAARMFGDQQILLPAKDLLDLPEVGQGVPDTDLDEGPEQQSQVRLVYWHILLPRHEIIWANGALVESFLPTALSLGALAAQERRQILRVTDQLGKDPNGAAAGGKCPQAGPAGQQCAGSSNGGSAWGCIGDSKGHEGAVRSDAEVQLGYRPARTMVSGARARRFVARLLRNRKPMVQGTAGVPGRPCPKGLRSEPRRPLPQST